MFINARADKTETTRDWRADPTPIFGNLPTSGKSVMFSRIFEMFT